MRSKWMVSLSALLLTGALAGGCGHYDGNRSDSDNELRQNKRGEAEMLSSGDYPPRPADSVRTPGVMESGQGERINAEQLAHIAEQVPGVERAAVAMNTTDVLVGIEVDNTGKRRILEKQVMSALHWQYPEYRYHVTSDEMYCGKIKATASRKNGIEAQMYNQDIEILSRSIDRLNLP
ncbi:YhcN/YlaJ family sporulation lipoprotein [Paenibacillus sp. PL2-23]|uniref:YhcN/YlaJ family sporulation lipoprotein n=1 Tax=Paenibacillus sp. PL2-23 TaxID=2100729 RepID=UPI0030FC1A08